METSLRFQGVFSGECGDGRYVTVTRVMGHVTRDAWRQVPQPRGAGGGLRDGPHGAGLLAGEEQLGLGLGRAGLHQDGHGQ